MAKCNSHNIYPNLNATASNEWQFRLNKINKIKDYFIDEIRERQLMSKRLSKYIASFDYFDKSLIALSSTTGSISIASFACYWSTRRKVSANFSLAFPISTGIVKKLLN